MTHRRLLLSVIPLLITVGCASILGDFEVTGDPPQGGDEGGTDASADTAADTAVNEGGLSDSPDEAGDAGCKVPTGGAILDDAVDVSAGYNNTCAIRQDGALYCWGDNNYGQLGVPPATALASSKPVKVQFPAAELGNAKIRQVALGQEVAFAIDEEFRLWAWGSNESGLLAIGSKDSGVHAIPAIVKVGGQPLFTRQIAASWFSACALAVTGDIYCWGENSMGQLGANPPAPPEGTPSYAPIKAFSTVASPGANAILAGGIGSPATCYFAGSMNDGMRCWGQRSGGIILANLTSPPQGGVNYSAHTTLTTAGAAMPYKQVAYGTNYGAALDNSGRLFSWGYGNNSHQGPGGPPAPGTAKATPSGPYLHMAAGYVFTCVVDEQAQVRCRGNNAQSQLGRVTANAADEERLDPVVANGMPLTNVRSVHAGFFHACAILRGVCGPEGPGAVKCWGSGDKGKLGNGAETTSITPVDVKAP